MLASILSSRRLLLRGSLLLALLYGCGYTEAPIPSSADAIHPVALGERATDFVVRTVTGDKFVFEAGALDRPTILVSFRGGWCPYCNLHLSELRHVLPEIHNLGVDVLFLSGDRPDQLYRSLSEDTQQDIDGRDYRIVSDAEATAAIALGIAFRVSERTIERRHEKGQDVAGSSMLKHRVLPVPAVIAIGRDGVVKFVFAAPDYKIRLPAGELLAVAQSLTSD